MAFTTLTPGKFSAEAAVAGRTGSGVFVASGPASSLATHQFGGVIDANGQITAAATVNVSAKLRMASGKAFVIRGLLTGARTNNSQRGFIRIITGGSAKLVNSFIKSKYTPIFLTPHINTAVAAAPVAFLKSGRLTAGSTIICLKASLGTAISGTVFWHVLPES